MFICLIIIVFLINENNINENYNINKYNNNNHKNMIQEYYKNIEENIDSIINYFFYFYIFYFFLHHF